LRITNMFMFLNCKYDYKFPNYGMLAVCLSAQETKPFELHTLSNQLMRS